MYLPFKKSCSKLLVVKYITLNSPLILSMSLVKQINTCSIILNYTNPNITNQNKIVQKISKTNAQVSFLHYINIPKHKIKLQMPYWITNLIKKKKKHIRNLQS